MRASQLTDVPPVQLLDGFGDGFGAVPIIPARTAVLPNGLTLVVHEDRRNPLVATQLRFNVGARDEPAGRTGFAHLFEHLMFKESAHRRGNWHDTLQRLGGSGVNGTTNFDRTNYFQTVPKAALDYLLWMESDRMGHLLGALTPQMLADEVAVIKNEKREHEGAPYGGAQEMIGKLLYPPEHPYGHTVLGSFEDLDQVGMETVGDWHARWYGAANAVLAIVGDVGFDEALERTSHWFGAIPAGTPARRVTRWMPDVRDTRAAMLFDRVPHRRLQLVWTIPPGADADAIVLQLVAQLLGGGGHSRLARRLVESDRLCLGIGAFAEARAVCGEFHIVATLAPNADAATVRAAILAEIADLVAKGPQQVELELIRAAGRGNFARMLDDPGFVADALCTNMISTGDPNGHVSFVEAAERASVDTIRMVAAAWLGKPAVELEVRPFTAVSAPAATAAARSCAPPVGEMHAAAFPQVERLALDNGLAIHLAHRPAASGINITLLLDNGIALDPVGAEGLTMATLAMLDGGTARRSKRQLSEAVTAGSMSYSTNADMGWAVLSIDALRERAGDAAQLLAELFLEAVFPPDEVALFLKRRVTNISTERIAPASAASMAVSRLIFGPGHRNSRPRIGTVESLSTLTRDMMVQRRQSWLDPQRARLVIVGDLSAEQARDLAHRAFGGWTGQASSPRDQAPDAGAPAPGGRYLIERPGAVQSALHIAMVSPDLLIGDAASSMFNRILGGSFGSRLNANLRVRRGWTYGITSRVTIDQFGGRFDIVTQVQADRTLDTLAQIEIELKAIAGDRPIAGDELEEARHAMLVGLPSRWLGNAAVMQAVLESILFELPDGFHDGLEARIRAVSLGDVAAVAQRLCDPAGLHWVVAGDPAQLRDTAGMTRAGMTRAGMTRAGMTRIDAEGRPL